MLAPALSLDGDRAVDPRCRKKNATLAEQRVSFPLGRRLKHV